MGASPDTRSPLPTAPPDTLLTHSSILENTGALEQRHVDVMERVGGGWVGGLAEPEDGAAEAAERRSSMGVRRVGGRCSRGGGDVAVLHRELDGRARVRRVLLRAGEVREECLPGSRDVHLLTASLTALETVSGPGYCLITSMPMVWSVVLCVEVGFLGAMRAVCCVSRDGRCTPYSRAPPV